MASKPIRSPAETVLKGPWPKQPVPLALAVKRLRILIDTYPLNGAVPAQREDIRLLLGALQKKST